MDNVLQDLLAEIKFTAMRLERTDDQVIIHVEQSEKGFGVIQSRGMRAKKNPKPRLSYSYDPADMSKEWFVKLDDTGTEIPMNDELKSNLTILGNKEALKLCKHNSYTIKEMDRHIRVYIQNNTIPAKEPEPRSNYCIVDNLATAVFKNIEPPLSGAQWKRIYDGEPLKIRFNEEEWNRDRLCGILYDGVHTENLCMRVFDRLEWPYKKVFRKEIQRWLFLSLSKKYPDTSKLQLTKHFCKVTKTSGQQFHPVLKEALAKNYLVNMSPPGSPYLISITEKGKQWLGIYEDELYLIKCWSYIVKRYLWLYDR